MMRTRKRLNPRLVKINRTYTVEEIACLFGIHKNTVRVWLKSGLEPIDHRRPALILGAALADFLRAKRKQRKHPCQAGEMYCVRCRAPKQPAGNMAEYRPITDKLGNLMGICPACESMIFRRVSLAKLRDIQGFLEVTFTEAERQVNESFKTTVNSDFI
jgi:hypothetical protein